MKRALFALALVLVTVSSSRASGQTLYAATGSNGAAGKLYTVDPATGASTLVGPTVIGASAIGLTGLAVHPATGILYGATSNATGVLNPRSLVTINPATGAAALIGQMANPVGDITFDSGSTLYGWSANQGTQGLYRINLSTAAQTRVPPGDPGFAGGGGNGLSFARGKLYLTGNAAANVAGPISPGATGALRTVDPSTGITTVGPTLTGAPQPGNDTQPGQINALAVDPNGLLFGVNSNNQVPAKSNLVVIDPAAGAVSNRGALPDNTDALAFTNGAVGTPPGSYFAVTPCRILDTRPNAPIPAGGTRSFTLADGTCGIAAAARAVSLNVTVTNVGATGHLVLYAGNQGAPPTSSISFNAGRTRANNEIVQVATDGSGAINILNVSSGQVDVVIDVNGFFQ